MDQSPDLNPDLDSASWIWIRSPIQGKRLDLDSSEKNSENYFIKNYVII